MFVPTEKITLISNYTEMLIFQVLNEIQYFLNELTEVVKELRTKFTSLLCSHMCLMLMKLVT